MREQENLKSEQSPLASNELLGSPLMKPRNVILYHTQEPRNDREPRYPETSQQSLRGALPIHSSCIVKTKCEATQRLS
jgi:hypothetical protein